MKRYIFLTIVAVLTLCTACDTGSFDYPTSEIKVSVKAPTTSEDQFTVTVQVRAKDYVDIQGKEAQAKIIESVDVVYGTTVFEQNITDPERIRLHRSNAQQTNSSTAADEAVIDYVSTSLPFEVGTLYYYYVQVDGKKAQSSWTNIDEKLGYYRTLQLKQ